MAEFSRIRASTECVLLVALDVAPSWNKSRRAFHFWLISGSLVISSLLFSNSFDQDPPLSFSILFILRRFLSSWARQRWVNLIPTPSRVGSKRQIKSLLSPPSSWWEFIEILEDGGPLGPGCAKLIDSCIGTMILLIYNHQRALDVLPWTEFCSIGQLWPNWWLPFSVMCLSVAVNIVLWVWSSFLKKERREHKGVNRMVDGTRNRILSAQEHTLLIVWAFLNAFCEEVVSRGFNRWEFSTLWGTDGPAAKSTFQVADPSNLWQATTFGLLHFHGIPSGWTGVGLTLVYGWLMGLLQDAGGGLLYPILTHTVADYFIFSQIARRQ